VVLDAAHNVASIEVLLTTLDQSFAARRRWLIFATSRDKDVRGMLSLLLPRFDGVLLSRYATNPRGQPVEELAAVARELAAQLPVGGPGARVASVDAFPDLAAAWAAASERLGRDDLLVITGSFFTAAEMLTAIRERPLR
jgi:dihydrofolate synthase/folylpolyglutamate synthase